MNIITKSVEDIQNIYQRVIGKIEDKKEKEETLKNEEQEEKKNIA